MAYLYLDATAGWSNPAATPYKYLRADGVYAPPVSKYKFLDATSNWSTPTVSPLAGMTWTEIAAEATKAASNPTEYQKWLGEYKIIPIEDVSFITAKLIGIAHDDLTSGGVRQALPSSYVIV